MRLAANFRLELTALSGWPTAAGQTNKQVRQTMLPVWIRVCSWNVKLEARVDFASYFNENICQHSSKESRQREALH